MTEPRTIPGWRFTPGKGECRDYLTGAGLWDHDRWDHDHVTKCLWQVSVQRWEDGWRICTCLNGLYRSVDLQHEVGEFMKDVYTERYESAEEAIAWANHNHDVIAHIAEQRVKQLFADTLRNHGKLMGCVKDSLSRLLSNTHDHQVDSTFDLTLGSSLARWLALASSLNQQLFDLARTLYGGKDSNQEILVMKRFEVGATLLDILDELEQIGESHDLSEDYGRVYATRLSDP